VLEWANFLFVLLSSADAKRALALLERVQQKVTNNDAGNGVASQVQTDLDLLTSLLQNPVLRNILKLEDSLEELNQHLMHHPSLLPSDFDIDKSGTLVVNQNILQTNRSSFKTKGGKSSPALSNTSSSKQLTVSPENHKREVAKTGAAFQQSILQAAAKREIIAIQVKPKKKNIYSGTSARISPNVVLWATSPFIFAKSNVP